MNRPRRMALTLLLTLGVAALASAETPAPAPSMFKSRIEPLLARKCFNCHGAALREGGLDLRSVAGMIRGGGRGSALKPGDAGASLIYRMVSGSAEPAMPPARGERLTPDELRSLALWISAGASETAPASAAGSQWKSDGPHWAFQPLKSSAPPQGGSATPVDAFLNERMRAAGITPAPPATRPELIRRATLDLHGLPPTPAEVQEFAKDPRPLPAAFAALVDRLLASPRYGERWARHWLDVVRYADTGGGSNDWERPNAWRYRDYVIRSLNNDLPYDRFVMEQIAGDEIDPENPEHLVATGFLRSGPWEHTGMSVAALTRQQWLDDVTNITSVAFLGLTAGCARCHDHKFDPLPTRDYYSLQAAFASTSFAERPAPLLGSERSSRMQTEQARYRQKLEQAQRDLKLVQARTKAAGVAASAEEGAASRANPQDLELERALRKRVEAYQRALRRFEPEAFSVRTGERDDTVHVLVGGSLTSKTEQVRPGVLQIAATASNPGKLPAEAAGRRLALARWIVHPGNPLTARVIVNRVWQHHFGRGIVATSNNLGVMGEKPTHPELLDWLAGRFMERDGGSAGMAWRLKSLQRLMMNSEAYRRSDRAAAGSRERDPEGRLLSWFPPRRLQAEELRDSMLAVAGELNPEMYGPPVFPEINEELAAQPRLIMGSVAPAWQPSPRRADRARRTIYTFQQRSMMDPLVEVFDGAPNADSCERRNESIVAPQVFNLMNSRFSQQISLAFARRLQREAEGLGAQINLAFRLAHGRPPALDERTAALRHVRAMAERHAQNRPAPPEARKPLVRRMIGEFTGALVEIAEDTEVDGYEAGPHPALESVETRALAELCLVLLNSNEFIYVY